MNVGSVKNKADSIKDYIIHSKADIMVISESWLFQDPIENATYVNAMVPLGYKLIHNPRSDGRIGGGVGIIARNSVDIKRVKKNKSSPISEQFEHLECVVSLLKDQRSNVKLAVVYRPSPTSVNGLKVKEFWKDWKKFLNSYAKEHREFIILGDLNFHLDETYLSTTKKFNTILEGLDLVQLVSKPTHTAGHILDVVITKPENNIISDSLIIHDPGLSDRYGNVTTNHHFAIDMSLNYSKPGPSKKSIQYRSLNNINQEAFSRDLANLNLECILPHCATVDEMVSILNECLEKLLDTHAPVISRVVIDRPNTSWYTNELATEKRLKRQLERRWYATNLHVHRLEYRRQCAVYNALLFKASIQDTSSLQQRTRKTL